jgi:hypothetical protein
MPQQITTNRKLPDAQAGVAYGPPVLQALGGRGTKRWTTRNNTNPSWATLSIDGLISGIPPAAGSVVNWKIRCTDDVNWVEATFNFTITPANTSTPFDRKIGLAKNKASNAMMTTTANRCSNSGAGGTNRVALIRNDINYNEQHMENGQAVLTQDDTDHFAACAALNTPLGMLLGLVVWVLVFSFIEMETRQLISLYQNQAAPGIFEI